MANSTATFRLNCSYTGVDSESASIPQQSVAVPYQSQVHGVIDVPDGTAGSTAYTIPFGSIGVEAQGWILENATGQDLSLKINGSAALQRIPDGGIICQFAAEAAGGTPVTGLSLTTTGSQTGAGHIRYHLFGDATA